MLADTMLWNCLTTPTHIRMQLLDYAMVLIQLECISEIIRGNVCLLCAKNVCNSSHCKLTRHASRQFCTLGDSTTSKVTNTGLTANTSLLLNIAVSGPVKRESRMYFQQVERTRFRPPLRNKTTSSERPRVY